MSPLLATLLLQLLAAPIVPPPEPPPDASADEGEMMEMDMSRDGPPGANLPHAREGSGTSWMPDATPLYAHHWIESQWMLMLHYSALAGYDDQWSDRGSRRFLSTNWIMGMASHPLFGGELTLRGMLSLEPLTAAGSLASPLLLQSGETYDGVPLHDRQHPHDFFMETAVLYRHALAGGLGLERYGAPSGEPALGPTAFMHRLSAMDNPFAPITHHWQDSTHISFPVLTAGLYTEHLKLEGSLFHGREPDEDRWNFDFGALDSWSLRASANPLPELSAEISWGYLRSPEALAPAANEHRLVGSIQWTRPLLSQGTLAATVVYGRKLERAATNSLLVEARFDLDGDDVPFFRFEWVQKLGGDLVAPGDPDAQYAVSALVLGYARRLPQLGPVSPMVGIAINVDRVPDSLSTLYGTQTPLGGFLFIAIGPPKLDLTHMMMRM